MSGIIDPINDVEELRAIMREKNGFQAQIGKFVYATIPGCTLESMAEAEKKGWHHVHIFKGDDYEIIDTLEGNYRTVLFRRDAPEFYFWDNPWQEKGPLLWLPNLDARIPPKLKPLLESSGPQGGLCIARRYRCACGEKKLRIMHSETLGRVEAACTDCGDRKILLDKKSLEAKNDSPPRPDNVPPDQLTNLKCKCNTKPLSPLFVLEYAPETEEGWDFSYIKIIALCRNCGHSWFISELAL